MERGRVTLPLPEVVFVYKDISRYSSPLLTLHLSQRPTPSHPLLTAHPQLSSHRFRLVPPHYRFTLTLRFRFCAPDCTTTSPVQTIFTAPLSGSLRPRTAILHHRFLPLAPSPTTWIIAPVSHLSSIASFAPRATAFSHSLRYCTSAPLPLPTFSPSPVVLQR